VLVADYSGVFIAIEGGDGSGKSTQARLLARRLRDAGREVVLTYEPGDTRIGPDVRRLVLDVASEGLDARAEALLYAADRAEHVAATIRPALERGAVVITDRYIDSSITYQGVGRGLGVDEIAHASPGWATGSSARRPSSTRPSGGRTWAAPPPIRTGTWWSMHPSRRMSSPT